MPELIIITSFFTVKRHRHYHHRQPFAKKLTHSKFPRGGYLLVHYPFASKLFSSNRNQIDDSFWDGDIENDVMANDILTEDMKSTNDFPSIPHMKNKHGLRFSREADILAIEHCCEHPNEDTCGHHLCN